MTLSGYVRQSKLDEYVTVIKFNDTVKKMETLEQAINDMSNFFDKRLEKLELFIKSIPGKESSMKNDKSISEEIDILKLERNKNSKEIEEIEAKIKSMEKKQSILICDINKTKIKMMNTRKILKQ